MPRFTVIQPDAARNGTEMRNLFADVALARSLQHAHKFARDAAFCGGQASLRSHCPALSQGTEGCETANVLPFEAVRRDDLAQELMHELLRLPAISRCRDTRIAEP
jgi:hypothetical protein